MSHTQPRRALARARQAILRTRMRSASSLRRRRIPSPATVLSVSALVLATSGVAIAAIPGGDGALTGCVAKSGSIKIIDAEAGKSCAAAETTVRLASLNALGKVANADAVDGRDSTDFLAATGKAADADSLDGKDWTSFVRLAGFVGPNGRVISGSGFTVTKRDTPGRYNVEIDQGVLRDDPCTEPDQFVMPVPVVSAYESRSFSANVMDVNSCGSYNEVQRDGVFTVNTYDATGTPVDTAFLFQVVYP